MQHPWFKATTLPMLYPVAEGAEGLARALEGLQAPGEPGDRRRAQRADPLRPRHLPRAGGHPEPARHGGGPPPPHAPGRAHPRGPRPRDGRRPRGAPHVPPHRVRRRRRESLGGLRDPGRHDPAGSPPRDRPPGGREELHQGAQQGDPQGHGQDGDLGAAELLRRPDLRGHRPRQERGRPLLHGHALPRQRDRPRRDRGGGAPAARARVPRPAGRARGARLGGRVPVAPGRGVPPVQPRDGAEAPARDAERPVPDLQGVHPRRGRAGPEPRHPPGALRRSSPPRRRCRSTRSSRSSRSSGTSRRGRCPTARSARRPTRRSPSR